MKRSDDELRAFLAEHGIDKETDLEEELEGRGWEVTSSVGLLGGWHIDIMPNDGVTVYTISVNAGKIDEQLALMRALEKVIEREEASSSRTQEDS